MARQDSARKRRILESAVTVFADEGLKGATIRKVATAAKVNSALLYYYFEDKQKLCAEAIRFVIHGFLLHMHEKETSFRSASDRIRFLVDSIVSYYEASPDRLQLLFLAFTKYPELFASVLGSYIRENPSLLPLRFLTDGMQKGQLRRVPPVNAWWVIMGSTMFTLRMLRTVDKLDSGTIPKPSRDLATNKNILIDLLTKGFDTRQ